VGYCWSFAAVVTPGCSVAVTLLAARTFPCETLSDFRVLTELSTCQRELVHCATPGKWSRWV